jgi:predicted ATPase
MNGARDGVTADPKKLLLEREAEAEALEGALEAAEVGSGRLVLLEGVTGEGKSELLALARRKARNLGLEVLAARGSEV